MVFVTNLINEKEREKKKETSLLKMKPIPGTSTVTRAKNL